MLADLLRDSATFFQSDLGKYAAAGLGLVAFVGIYYLGDYLFSDRDPEAASD
ncbi:MULTISPECIES: hypothetical protein [Bradyrhizobium]|uniref:hypothetical protein n=1 Tax=Bradyrhizobium TaxID=374 RepID=UPI0012EC0A52|nr:MULTISPECIES: hypothetical protein [Bradyrhizobium]UFW47119.1 hypothetical protein BaraCB756_33295 [Bradyrhizobium arachidis]